VARTLEIEEGLSLNLDENGKLTGLEMVDATENLILEEKWIKEER